MDHMSASAFAKSWVQAWNGHDVDAVLDHFTDDAAGVSGIDG